MPWVRLHGIKDYYGMAWLARQHPRTHLTFNLVPSLLIQLEDYATGQADEVLLALTAKAASELDEGEVRVVLDEFFHANWPTMIRPHARYRELLLRRRFDRRTAEEVRKGFTVRDLRDLQVWATLAWFFPQLQRDDPVLRELVAKGRGFTEDDKSAMLAKQQEVLAGVAGMYRELQDSGSAELSVSPFYHPILPLLCNMERSREALPDLPLPRGRADFAEDARTQVMRAVEAYERLFGRAPRGMWPSEGSVSPEVCPLAAEAGIRWIATDEGILSRSLGRKLERDGQGYAKSPEILYQPYRIAVGDKELAVVFRDHYLSDLIGFRYQHVPAADAADDLMARLEQIGARSGGEDAFVSIILDGENAWEHYRDSGMEFLDRLYGRLASAPNVHPVGVSEYLEAHPPKRTLPRLFSGSWINSDFAVWIGHAEDRLGWERVGETREFLVRKSRAGAPDGALRQAWEELYIAEGSDWFWWYGDDRNSDHDAEFDRLFRQHLKNAYVLLGEEAPPALDEPISRGTGRVAYTRPTGFMAPELDGRASSFFEWLSAGVYRRELDRGVMDKQTGDRIRRVHFGFSESELFLRVDSPEHFTRDMPPSGRLVFCFSAPAAVEIEVGELCSARPRVRIGGEGVAGARAAAGEILELACPFAALGLRPRETARFHVRLVGDDGGVERAPRAGAMVFEVPTPDFERERWLV